MTEKNNYQILIIGPYPPPYGGISVYIERLKVILDSKGNFASSILDLSGRDVEKKKTCKDIIPIKGNKIFRLVKSLIKVKKFKGDIIHYHTASFGNFRYAGILLSYSNIKAKKILTIHGGSFVNRSLRGNLKR